MLAMHLHSTKSKLILITCLYIIQGIPQGLANLMTILLVSASSSYSDLAVFSMTYYPYSFKILWSPIVDTVFVQKLGRRRSWILPTQFCIGLLFLCLGAPSSKGSVVTTLIEENRILPLTALFFLLFFCTSTQDIALDAWALKLLPLKERYKSSTCQTAGLTLGNAIGYNLIIALMSPSFCRVMPRLWPAALLAGWCPLTLGFFASAFGCVVLCLNLYIFFFVSEGGRLPTAGEEKAEADAGRGEGSQKDEKEGGNEKKEKPYRLKMAYASILTMVRNKYIRRLMLVIITSVVPFGANLFLKETYMIRLGVKRELFAVLDLLAVPASLAISGYFMNKKEGKFLMSWLRFFSINLAISSALSIVIFLMSRESEKVPVGLLVAFSVLDVLFAAFNKVLFILYFAFCSDICDESYGGTYLTFLAVTFNFGHVWVKNMSFSL